MNTYSPSGSELVEQIRDRLIELGLQTSSEVSGPSSQDSADLRMLVPTKHGLLPVAIDIKRVSGLKGTVSAARHAASRWAGPEYRILGVPHVSPTARQQLDDLDIDFVDSGGNARIRRPGFLVDVRGRKARIALVAGTDRPSRAFRPAGMRVVFALLVQPELTEVPVRELSAATGVSIGAVHNTMKDLREEGLLTSTTSQTLLTHPQRLIRRWLEHFESDLRPSLKQRTLRGPDPQWWRKLATSWTDDTRAQIGGEAAVELAGAGLRATTTTLYGSPPWHDLVRVGRLLPDPSPNVYLRERFWNPTVIGGGTLVPDLLVYADLVASGDPRQRAAAEEVWGDGADLRRLQKG